MVSVALIGASGYTGLEVARCLIPHPEAELTIATSRDGRGQPLASVHPMLAGRTDLTVTTMDAVAIAQQCDIAMCCLPHGASAETVRRLVEAGIRVIDFSADFRLSSVQLYESLYGVTHPWPQRVGNVVYGLPEFFADAISTADLVANPGCYPTGAILPLAPLVQHGVIDLDDIIVDSKTGVSGAGRTPKVGTLYCEANESIAAYGVGTHRHGPEIRDLIHRIAGHNIELTFTPHLTPMDRGILSTIYVRPANGNATDCCKAIESVWRDAFHEQPFVHVVDHLPATKHVALTNHVQMVVRPSGGRCVIVTAIDNLAKGASTAAIQNMNVMSGLPSTTGL